MEFVAHADASACPVDLAIRTIGGRWRMLVLRSLLMEGEQRYNSLLNTIAGISAKELTRNLRSLEEAGLITREVRRLGATLVDVYAVTELGTDLLPAFRILGSFGLRLAATHSDPATSGAATR
ncbi:winged helix-turn-helix transcriptional regulator [Nocardia sp. NPDC052566]|uniref:winged helix-turn-helix transcriptional regulator n=1 Tax=Nocardia sp. NPDC052566 TaxID=3364330 RepID=UPI0037C9889E